MGTTVASIGGTVRTCEQKWKLICTCMSIRILTLKHKMVVSVSIKYMTVHVYNVYTRQTCLEALAPAS